MHAVSCQQSLEHFIGFQVVKKVCVFLAEFEEVVRASGIKTDFQFYTALFVADLI